MKAVTRISGSEQRMIMNQAFFLSYIESRSVEKLPGCRTPRRKFCTDPLCEISYWIGLSEKTVKKYVSHFEKTGILKVIEHSCGDTGICINTEIRDKIAKEVNLAESRELGSKHKFHTLEMPFYTLLLIGNKDPEQSKNYPLKQERFFFSTKNLSVARGLCRE